MAEVYVCRGKDCRKHAGTRKICDLLDAEGDMAKIKSLLTAHIDRTRQAYKSAAIVLEGATAS